MFEIKPLDNQISAKNSNIPRLPFNLAIVSPKGSGKTTLLINLLVNEDFYKKKFNDIYIFSPTFHNDEKWKKIFEHKILLENKFISKLQNKNSKKLSVINDEEEEKIKFDPYISEDNIYTEYSDSVLKDIVDKQDNFIKQYSKEKANDILIIFDDCVGSGLFSSRYFLKLNTIMRHFKISIIMISQVYKVIAKSIRTNLSNLLLFDINNSKELEVIYEENEAGLSKNDWMRVYRAITKNDYSFMFLNFQNKKGFQILNCFKNIIL